jgi:hypothetical protein
MKPQRRFVDLSIYLDVLSDPPPLAPKITYQKRADTVPEFMAMLPGAKPEDYPEGEAAAAFLAVGKKARPSSTRPCRSGARRAPAGIGLDAKHDSPVPLSGARRGLIPGHQRTGRLAGGSIALALPDVA